MSTSANMTESDDGIVFGTDHLVSVRALVMVRDDNTGGWVPMGGGGLSNVSVQKCVVPCDVDQVKHEYLIIGRRISDESVILSCVIKKDFEYNKVMPTFHHWKTGEKKFGLTFQTAADARAFDKGLRTAVDELLDGIAEKPASRQKHTEPGDDEVFMTLDLPERADSHSSTESTVRESHQTPPEDQLAQMSSFFSRINSDQESPNQSDKYPFLQLTAVHDYIYPDVDDTKLVPDDSTENLRNTGVESAPAVPAKTSKIERRQFCRNYCRYCQELYLENENRKGSCEYAPDCMRTTVDEVSCIRCARCMLYHCMADEEGDFAQHPCDCNTEEGCSRRWMGLTLLSIFVPCLWFYPPLRACHWCCIRCGLCGGRHRPAS